MCIYFERHLSNGNPWGMLTTTRRFRSIQLPRKLDLRRTRETPTPAPRPGTRVATQTATDHLQWYYIIHWKQTYNLCLRKWTIPNFKRKIWNWAEARTRTSRSLSWQLNQDNSMVERQVWRSEFESRFRFKFFSWNLINNLYIYMNYGNRRFNTSFTTLFQSSLTWAKLILIITLLYIEYLSNISLIVSSLGLNRSL